MQFLQHTQPRLYGRAVALRRSNPAMFNMLISRAAPSFRRLEQMQKTQPALFHETLQDIILTHRSFRLAQQLRNPHLPAAQRAALKNQLLQVVKRQFAVRQKIREMQLNVLGKRVQKLKTQLEQRQKQRQQIINKRVAALLGKLPGVNW